MKLILLRMEITCIRWFHMYAHYLESVKSIDQTAMLQDLKVVLLHELSTDSRLSILGIYLLHERTFFTSSALGLADTVGNFEVSNC